MFGAQIKVGEGGIPHVHKRVADDLPLLLGIDDPGNGVQKPFARIDDAKIVKPRRRAAIRG